MNTPVNKATPAFHSFTVTDQTEFENGSMGFNVIAFSTSFGDNLVVAQFPHDDDKPEETQSRDHAYLLAQQFAYTMNVMNSLPQIQAPVMDPTKTYHEQYRLERAILANLIHHMQQRGFEVYQVNDGEEVFTVNNDLKAAMEVIDSVDESTIYFRKAGHKRRFVSVIGGNGQDVICDWSDPEHDTEDGFALAMEAFDPYKIKAL